MLQETRLSVYAALYAIACDLEDEILEHAQSGSNATQLLAEWRVLEESFNECAALAQRLPTKDVARIVASCCTEN